ncbi:MAG: protein phosphatase 2C domain-containing protein [Planctomycetota bacterium]|nr:protein phosphatase 2C domain-containing protein [Planctomycetota bacterium]
MTDDSIPSPAALDRAPLERMVGSHRDWLAERGQPLVGSGCFRVGPWSGAVHTDFGPLDQDKTTNQDYALAWWPDDDDCRTRIRWALAMADGLSSSFRSEWASELASWTALRALVELSATEPRQTAQQAFDAAGAAIGRLADEWAADPQGSCPPGQYLATWKYMLRKGSLLQTTLTLAWLDKEYFRVAILGDAGLVWREYPDLASNQRPRDRVIAECDLAEQQVFALGPAERQVSQFDQWEEIRLPERFLAAFYTDGIGRGIGKHASTLLDDLEARVSSAEVNHAQAYIAQAIARQPRDFEDNLTLAVIRGARSWR